LKTIPQDPKTGSASATGYSVSVDSHNMVSVNACGIEGLATSQGSHDYVPIDSTYKLVFDDEFNGSTVDTNNWAVSNGPDHTYNGTSAYFTPANLSVHNGCLDMAITQPTGGINGATYATSALTGTYPSGGVTGPGVYWEARTKYSRSTVGGNNQADYGLAEDFWTDVGPGSSPTWQYPEIDFSEWWGFQPTYSNGNWNPGAVGGNQWYPSTPGYNFGTDLTTGWHIWSALWTATSITFYLDGVQFYQTTASVNQAVTMWNSLLSATIAGTAGNNPNGNTVLPAHYFFDYVHVYKQNGTPITPEQNYGGPGDSTGSTICSGN
jgi:hypothetical protein